MPSILRFYTMQFIEEKTDDFTNQSAEWSVQHVVGEFPERREHGKEFIDEGQKGKKYCLQHVEQQLKDQDQEGQDSL